ncbi:MAG: glycosyltransferase [Candidatus Omnitrophica bacterium]|nr:glycosyltransferase [Candidatus Omnitrophota bacterium]
MENPELSIILPTLNERENLAVLIPGIEKFFHQVKHEIIIVDDNSTDNTSGLALELNKTYGNIRFITRKNKRGIGSALHEGYDFARSGIILSSDADLSFSVKDMKKLFDKIIEGYDLVVGCRHSIRGSYYEMKDLRTTIKGLISKLGNNALKILSGLNIDDFSANFRAIKKDSWNVLEIDENTNVMLFEMIIKAKHKGLKIAQVPVTFVDRVYGQSKLNLMIEIPKAFLKTCYYLIKYR